MDRAKQLKLTRLGDLIAAERKKRGISLEKLAYSVDLSKGTLSAIENGKSDPRYSTLNSIAGGLGITVSQLLRLLPR